MNTPIFMKMLLASAAILITLTQCGSDDPKPVKQPDVYVAGSFNTLTAPEYNWVPGFWKNGEFFKLSDSPGEAKGIAVIGDDVYVVGKLNDSEAKLRLWTNGTIEDMTNGSEQCYIVNMKVIGTDWYAIGYTFESGAGFRPAYWKNKEKFSISNPGESYAYDLTVDEGIVYVVGRGIHESGYNKARIWVNGVGSDLSNGTSNVTAYGVAVLNGVVYVSGQDENTLVQWTDGTPQNVGGVNTSGTSYGSLTVIGNDVYLAGYDNNVAKYWKNGLPVEMSAPNGSSSTFGYTLAAVGKDIYVLGEGSVGNNWPALVWKNGALVDGFNGSNNFSAYAFSVAMPE